MYTFSPLYLDAPRTMIEEFKFVACQWRCPMWIPHANGRVHEEKVMIFCTQIECASSQIGAQGFLWITHGAATNVVFSSGTGFYIILYVREITLNKARTSYRLL